jgi:signal recognition particle receptor subunit beta
MAVINFARREIEAKVVYYGPALSGKTTNVQVLHGLVPDGQRGDLHTMATAEERTLFFDYVPVQLGQIAGFHAKFKLFTVPGQVFYKETRRVVLQGADAVVFVADSGPDRGDANIDALIDLEENLRSHGLDLASIPLVIQVNKRDLPDARTVEDIQADLNPFGVPMIEAVAFEGRGVMETLRAVTDLAAQRIRDNLAGRETAVQLTAVDRAEAESDQKVIREHLEKIKRVRPFEEQRGQKLKSGGHVKSSDVDAFLLENVERASEFLESGNVGPAAAAPAIADVPEEMVVQRAKKPPAPPPVPAAPPPVAKPPPAKPMAGKPGAVSGAHSRPLPPPPPLPAEKERPPAPGALIEAAVGPEGWVGARVEQVRGARFEGGAVYVDVIIDHSGTRRLHPVKLVARPAPPPPPAAGPGLLGVVGAAVIAGGLGLLAGVVVGYLIAPG